MNKNPAGMGQPYIYLYLFIHIFLFIYLFIYTNIATPVRVALMGAIDGRWGHSSRQLGVEMAVYASRHQCRKEDVFFVFNIYNLFMIFLFLSIMRGTRVSNE